MLPAMTRLPAAGAVDVRVGRLPVHHAIAAFVCLVLHAGANEATGPLREFPVCTSPLPVGFGTCFILSLSKTKTASSRGSVVRNP